VVRLKSGDLFVCSRAAEEIAALADRGVPVTTTPGVSAATAAPLAAGMVPRPGTAVSIALGDDDPVAAPVRWEALAAPGSMLVVLTGRAHQRRIASRLMSAGAAPSTPAAVVHAAGRRGTQVAATDLARVGTARLQPPATMVIGPVRGGGGAHP
jgi:siroheme synthase